MIKLLYIFCSTSKFACGYFENATTRMVIQELFISHLLTIIMVIFLDLVNPLSMAWLLLRTTVIHIMLQFDLTCMVVIVLAFNARFTVIY